MPNAAAPAVGGQTPVVAVANISALRSLTTRASLVAVMFREVAGDGSGGMFQWEAISDLAVDGAMVVAPEGGPRGRYLRVFSGVLPAAWIGVDIQAAIDAAQILRANVQISKVTDLHKTLVLRGGVNLQFTSGANGLHPVNGTGLSVRFPAILGFERSTGWHGRATRRSRRSGYFGRPRYG